MTYEVHLVYDVRIHNVYADTPKQAEHQVHGALKMLNAHLAMAFGTVTLSAGSTVMAVPEIPPYYNRDWKIVEVKEEIAARGTERNPL